MTYQGHAGSPDALESLREVWDSMLLEAREFIETDEAIVALTHFWLRGHKRGRTRGRPAWAFWMRAGRIRRMEQYGTKKEALEAAGLRE